MDGSEIQYYSNEDEIESETESETESDIESSDDSIDKGKSVESNVNEIVLEDLEESYYYNVCWTAEEKENLFKGIEKYGKWNVDKIKKFLPNKNTIDIRMYISLLHKKYKYVKKNRSQDLHSKDEIYRYYEDRIIESTEEEIKKEEEEAQQLELAEQSKFNDRHEFETDNYNMILKLFNVQLMLALTTKVFIRKKEAGIHKDTLVYIYLQYIHWLREVIKTVIVVTEKRRLKKKKKSKSYISLEDINEIFYLMNFNNYSADSSLSKLLFRKQGHLVLNSIFKIKHNFSNNKFVHPDAKKSIIDEELNTWIRPYDIRPRYYHSHYNAILKDSEQFKDYLESQKSKKTKSYQKFIAKQKKHIEEEEEENNQEENVDNIENDSNLEEGEKEEEEEEMNDENINEEVYKNDEEEEEENEEIDNNDEEDEDENIEDDFDEYDEQEDSIYEEESTTDDNYTDNSSVDSDEESNIDKLINSSFITRRSSQRISNSRMFNLFIY